MTTGQIIDLCLGVFMFGGSIFAQRKWDWNPVVCFSIGCYGVYLITSAT